MIKFRKIYPIIHKFVNFSSGCMHPPTLFLWVHWHPRHSGSRRLWSGGL